MDVMDLSNDKKIYCVYFLNLLISGFFYSFMTGTLIRFNNQNTLLILLISSVIDLLLLLGLKKTTVIQSISLRNYAWITFLICSMFFGLISFKDQLELYLLMYSVITLLISCMALILQEQILKVELSLTTGFFNIQLLRNGSKMLGFFLGILLSGDSLRMFFLYLCMIFLFFNSLFSFSLTEKVQLESVQRQVGILGKESYLLLGITGTTMVIWIPLITKTFIEGGLDTISWLPFLLPGITSILLIQLQKKHMWLFTSTVIEYIALLLFVLFFSLRILSIFPILQAIIFSFLTACLISLGIKVRKYFLQVNQENDMKYILQTLTVNGSFFSILLSLFGREATFLEIGLFVLNLLVIFYLLFRKEKYL
ncbi:hypothetical protein [Streptococcus sp. NLN76]|uniref:hypothetical protein n=1 Tax=Streptococcus sp. NLN76 TaxID=2822800 RepID=UPI0018A8881E|nr:hypothetical protein [Streptococcus sp. NLN76]MBF8970236.1 hypothetical protein [Streptococcus sp. NLN76]